MLGGNKTLEKSTRKSYFALRSPVIELCGVGSTEAGGISQGYLDANFLGVPWPFVLASSCIVTS